MSHATRSTARRPSVSPAVVLALCACGGSEPATTPDPTSPPAATSAGPAGGEAGGCDDRLLDPNPAPATLHVLSPAFDDGGAIPQRYAFQGFGCTGDNASLPLAWENVPEGTESFAVVVHDPDAPTGVGFFHWIVLDLPPSVVALPEGASTLAEPPGVQGLNDYGGHTYGGPCPPPGDPPHRYIVTVYAVDVPSLGLDATTSGALARFNLGQHTLALGRLTGTYGRPVE
ncbi:MAG: YbhB/YbcL family Raf kinase inhibitor-like protein [Sandaracinaceae bacterium]